MSGFKDWLNNARERYLSIRKLIKNSKEISPDSTQAFFKALQLFVEIENELNDFRSKNDEIAHHLTVIRALLNYEMGLISITLEKISESEKYFLKSIENIREHAMKPECVALYINIFVQASIMSAKRNEYELSQKACNKAHDAFDKYKLGKNPCPVVMFEDLFLPVEQRQSESEEGLSNLYLLENSTIKKLISLFNTPKFISNRLTKLKQLLKEDVGDEERLLWAARCDSLFIYFIDEEDFAAARYILSCANKVVDDSEKMFKKRNEAESSEMWENLSYVKTFIYYSWARYAKNLLTNSLINRMKLKAKWDAYLAARTGRSQDTESAVIIEMHELFEKDEIKEYEDKITCDLASNYTEALKIFQFGQNNIKLYEKSDAKCCASKINIDLMRDHSSLYLALTSFVEDPDVKCKMHKRRIDLLHSALEKVDKQINPKDHNSIIFDLGAAYYMMLHIKYEVCTSSSEKATSRNIDKVNSLAGKLIELYESHLDTYKDGNGQFPKSLQEDDVEPVLLIFNGLSHVYEKLISDKKGTLDNTKKAKELCMFIIDYITRNPSHQRFIEDNTPMATVIAHFTHLTNKEKTLHSEI